MANLWTNLDPRSCVCICVLSQRQRLTVLNTCQHLWQLYLKFLASGLSSEVNFLQCKIKIFKGFAPWVHSESCLITDKIADLTSLNYSCRSRSWNECIHGSPRYVTYAFRYKCRQQQIQIQLYIQVHVWIQIQIQKQIHIQIQIFLKWMYSRLTVLRYICTATIVQHFNLKN